MKLPGISNKKREVNVEDVTEDMLSAFLVAIKNSGQVVSAAVA